jgi:hypothetical protein
MRRMANLRKTRGWFELLKFLLHRTVARPWEAAVYDRDLSAELSKMESKKEEVFYCGGKDLLSTSPPELRCLLERPEDWEYLEGIKKGDLFYAVARDGKFLHSGFVMLQTRQTGILGESWGTPLIGNCNTMPSARGQGLYPRALGAVCDALKARGYSRVLMETDPANSSSRRGIEKAGFSLHRILRGWIFFNCICFFRVESKKEHGFRCWLIG